MSLRNWGLTLAMVLGGAYSLAAQTTTLAPIGDSYLRAGSPNQTGGTSSVLRVQGSGNNRAVLLFDQAAIVSAIGAGRLAAATLSLYVQSNGNNWGATGRTVDVHRMTADWTEAGATWNCPVDSQPSNSQPNCAAQWDGGAFEEEPSDSALHSNGMSGWISYDVTADVGAFAAGAANRGWLLKKSDESEAGMVEYASREAQADRRPRLVLLVESTAFDAVPPALRITAPASAVLVNVPAPTIVLAFSDGGAGVSLASLRVRVDQGDVTAGCTSTSTGATCSSPPLAAGAHTIAATLADNAGNTASATGSFQLLLGAGPHASTLAAAADTTLRGGERNQSFGSAASLDVRHSGPRRSLVRFDPAALGSLLQGAELVSATLNLYLETNGNNWGTSGRPVAVHRLTAPWTESTATWNCATDTQPTNSQPDCGAQWSGGSYATAATASVLHTKGMTGWVGYDVTADVRAFLTGTANHGWIVRKVDEGPSGSASYASREGTAGRAPQLALVFTAAVSDSTPPTISARVPADRTFAPNRRPIISAGFSDVGSGVDAGSVRIMIDGVDRTGGATVNAAAVTFTPTADLADGEHAVGVEVRDQAGNAATATWTFAVDATAPALAFASPPAQLLVQDPRVEISITFAETGAGVKADTFRLLVDGADATATCRTSGSQAFCLSAALASGPHTVAASVSDWVGNAASSSRSFDLRVDDEPPRLVIEAPQEGAVSAQPQAEVRGTVADDGHLDSVLVNGEAAAVSNGAFSAVVELSDGVNTIGVLASDSFDNSATATVNVVLDREAPTLELVSPVADQVVVVDAVHVDGFVDDAYGVAGVTVNGMPSTVVDGRFSGLLALSEGANEVVVAAVDRVGNRTEQRLSVTRFSIPDVQITAPADLSFLAATTVSVEGVVSEAGATVTVNGVAAVVTGTTFAAAGVPLIEGGNTVTATASNSQGHVATDTIMVVRDLTPPRVEVYYPSDGALLPQVATVVRGLVNDIVPGTVNASEATVTVNGRAAQVVNRSFVVAGVELVEGENSIEVVAVDESGNRSEKTLVVYREETSEPRILAVDGDGQSASIGAALARPLVVELRDASGQPAGGRPVAFRVTSGNGSLDGAKRSLVATTDSAGRASVTHTLGTRAGVANHVVEASAPGFSGPALFAASATPGLAALLVVDSGGLQVGVAGRELPRPLVAAVIDAGSNRLEGVPVTFRVTLGNGRFADDSQEKVVATDSDGRAITTFTLGVAEGIANNVVQATLAGGVGGKLGFVASGRIVGDPAATSVSGVVLDNTNQPLEGVTLRIKETALVAVSDAQGQFRITGVTPGGLKLVVDGSTATAPGPWPDVEFDLVAIPGRDTTVNMPIYLVPLALDNGVYVDEVNGGTLTLPDYPGFELEVLPGSVTFAGGSRSGLISVTVVHNDKVPMVPNFGQQPRFIVTIQPAGARFDPPARLTLPNVEGMTPGTVTEMYSFDHDLGHFVSIGPASVSNDGTVIRSQPGVGIVKAGWHCGGSPPPDGSGYQCPDGYFCDGTKCVPEFCPRGLAQTSGLALSEKAGTGGCKPDGCYPQASCSNGCRGPRVQITGVNVEGAPLLRPELRRATLVPVELETTGAQVTLTATTTFGPAGPCSGLTFDWSFGDGSPDEHHATSSATDSVIHTYLTEQNSGFPVTVRVRCSSCAGAIGEGRIVVSTYRVAMRLDLVGPIVISTDREHFEEATVKVRAVNKATGHPVDTFEGVTLLEEVGGEPGGPLLVYAVENHGEPPGQVLLIAGRGETILRSRAAAVGGNRPDPAEVKTADYPTFQDRPVRIEQWVDNGTIDPLWRGGKGYAWFQTMLKDIRESYGASGPQGSVLSAVSGYTIEDMVRDSSNKEVCGATDVYSKQISLSAACPGARYNGPGGVENLCNVHFDHVATGIFLHEARHAYQNLLVPDAIPHAGTNADGDLLPASVPVAPNHIIVDSTTSRDACDVVKGLPHSYSFLGDNDPDWDDHVICGTSPQGCPVSTVREWDAYTFSMENP